MSLWEQDSTPRDIDHLELMGAYISVHAMIPGRPFVNNLKSNSLPNLGLSSMPMYISYRTDPVSLSTYASYYQDARPLTTELSILLVRWAQMSFSISQSRQ